MTTLYGGVYRAVCLEVLTDRLRVQIPQLFATETVTIFESAGRRPQVGDNGWVAFESERPERPVWVGSESGGTPAPAIPNTTGVSLAALEAEVNKLKALLRSTGVILP